VLLDDADFERFREGGREDLLGKAYIKRARDGKVTLRFAETGKCQHLRRDKKCRIYTIRPDNCRAFVVGSEACLAAREDTLGYRDG
jgi:Fe-S-cluster containining protein